ncbi:MAG TPA: L-asparaginase [Kosmotogaceae bacterium]|nr:MAG: Asparaginase/glutaminase [Thermotogales bacterium 46_20]HAA86045.1 L-asparaginase [Kosmotogaceae bacterium]
MKKIVIVTTGGTIAMVRDPVTGSSVPATTTHRHLIHVEQLHAIAETEHYDFSNIPSPHMSPNILWELSRVVNRILKRDDVAGVVITHGTDTLEETAYFIDLTVQTEKPIILTAAMRNLDELGTDGPRNLLSSVRVAASIFARNLGTLVCVNDEIHAAVDVTKTYTSNIATFESPGSGPIGIVDDESVVVHRRPVLRSNYAVERIENSVALLKTFVGDKGDFIRVLPELGYKGLVLEAFGSGNVPVSVHDATKWLIEKHSMPVIITSRCFKGRVLGTYGYTGGGRSLKSIGAIFAQGLSSQKARIKLMVVMGKQSDLKSISEEFLLSPKVGG